MLLRPDRRGPVRAAITGVHGYLPDYVLGNDELSRMVDTSDQWITERTGIKERRILKGEGLGTSHMAVEAVKGLLEKTGTRPDEIDVLVCATITPDYVLPSTANLICDMVGMRHIGSFDIQAACSGFVYGLDVASQFIETGRAKKAILVGADKMSNMIDYTDRTTCVLFGDGAAAILLEPNDSGYGLQDIELHSDGAGMPHIHQKAGGSRLPPSVATLEARMHYLYLNGPAVFRAATERMSASVREIMTRNNLTLEDVDWFVPHQANKRILEAIADRLGIPHDKVMMTLQKYGNTTAATIPLCLWDYESKLKRGDRLVFAAFGGGFTWGSAYINWAYDGAKAAKAPCKTGALSATPAE
ncbi:MAG TPA: beta-ketoacyl-ACP synthase III [Xanthobacteraceae bacterium]|nr:beta-ketoacyl-ACP synthase III [Xanthobacteraceae bacterium]